MKAVVAAFNQEKALVGAFSVITNFCVDLHFKLYLQQGLVTAAGHHGAGGGLAGGLGPGSAQSGGQPVEGGVTVQRGGQQVPGVHRQAAYTCRHTLLWGWTV